MGAIRKLLFEEVPQSYSPKHLPEIIRLAGELHEQEAVVYRQGAAGPVLFETGRLLIRRFVPGDATAVQELAVDRHHSEMRHRDHPWPTDEKGCREATEWFSGQDNMWAVCLKPDYRLIGMVVFNTVDERNMVDLGHVWHTRYWHAGLDTEALSLMVRYAFEVLAADGVFAYNPLDCAPQIAPLLELGLIVTETNQASFARDEQGEPIYFTGCKLVLERERWNAQ
jgi:[ribosomal protein S5]-alanine N-acetyltransferase